MNTLIILTAKYLIILIVLIALIVFLKLYKNDRRKLLKLVILSFPISFILAKALSHFFYDTRPFVEQHIMPLIAHAPDNGFPSDHTLLAMAITGCVYLVNKRAGIWLFILTLILGIARVLSKVHHPIDILGSIIISAIGVYLAVLILRKSKGVDQFLTKILNTVNL